MTQLPNISLAEMDKSSLFHAVTSIADQQANGPSISVSASGVHITDANGRDLLDMGAGLWCVNAGYGRRELADAAQKTMMDLSFQHLFGGAASEPAIRLADRLLRLFRQEANAPHMARVFFGTSGSDANDTAVKMVRYYNNLLGRPKKKKIISRHGAYHGLTVAAGSLTGISGYHTAFDLPGNDVLHVSCPHFYTYADAGEDEAAFTDRMISELSALIELEGAETIAGFIAEPIMGTGGVLLPPKGYFEKVQRLLEQHDILFIVDEVITGFGRLGEWFGTGAYNLKPDIVSLAKGLTSAYFPLSASIVSDRIWRVFEAESSRMGAFMHGFTYSGHPVGCAVALANLDVLQQDRMVENAAVQGPYLLEALRNRVADHPFVGDVRGHGLMIGVEFVAERSSRKFFAPGSYPHKIVARHAAEKGVLTRALPYLPVTSFSPPLCVTAAEIDRAADLYADALKAATPELRALL